MAAVVAVMDISPQAEAESTAVVLAVEDKPGWTDGRVALLRLLWIDGLSCSQIADRLGGGLSRNAVIGKANRLYLNVQHPRVASINPADLWMRREKKKARQREYWARRQERITSDPNYRRPAKKSLPPFVIEELPPSAEFLAIPFLDLDRSQCRYSRGDGPDMRFCGQPVKSGHSWCHDCCKIVYRRAA